MGNKPDAIGDYLSAYKAQKAIEADLAKAKKITAGAKDGFIVFMEGNSFTSVKQDGSTITHSKRSFGKIVDFDALEEWVGESDEPRSLYMEEVFIKGSSKNESGIHLMISDAQAMSVKLHAPVRECLPPGLDLSVIDVVTVTSAGANTPRKKPKTAVEKLQQQMEDI